MSIRLKVLLAIVFAVMVTLAGVTATVSVQLQSALTSNFKQASQSQLDRVASFVHLFFETTIGDIAYIISQPETIQSVGHLHSYADTEIPTNTNSVEQYPEERLIFENLQRLQKSKSWYSLIYVGDSNSGFVQAPHEPLGVGYNPVKRPWFSDALDARKPVITEAYLSDNGDVVCTVAAPIPVAAPLQGVLGIDISLATLTSELARTKIGTTGYIILIDHTGQVLVAPNKEWLGKGISSLPNDTGKVLQQLVTMKNGVDEITLDKQALLAGVQTTPENWTLIMVQAKSEIFAEAMGLTLSIFGVGLIILGLMVALAYALSRSLVGPVVTLANAAAQVAEGDLQAIPVESKGFTGELGLLHASLKGMVSNLGTFIQQAESKAKEAESALEQAKVSTQMAEEAKASAEKARREGILDTANQISDIITEISNAVQSLSAVVATTEDSVGHQRERISENAAAMTEMNAAISEVAASISQTSAMADNARNQAQQGRQVVHDMVSSIEQVQTESTIMGKSLEELGTQVTDIGKIMGVINDIADQTNLLALNAAIEAARAGDAGRGFAVVADEVRKLAENTMQATKQVGDAITNIQKGTDNNLQAMQSTALHVTRSAELAHQAGDALVQIETMVDKTADQMRAVAAATEEQSATVEEINRGTEAVNQMADEVGLATNQSTHAVQTLMQLANKLNAVVQSLRQN